MTMQSATDVQNYVLRRADERTDNTSAFYTSGLIGNLLIEAWRALWTEHPFLGLLAYPPQAQVVPAAITGLTVSVAAGSTAATLSAVPTGAGGAPVSIANWWIILKTSPNGDQFYMRVTSHTAGSTSCTVDAAPQTLAAAACVIAQMELQLAAGTGVLANGLWTSGGGLDNAYVPLFSEEEMNKDYPGIPTQSWPPDMAARLTMTMVRLSHYDLVPHRVEIPYYQELADPSGAGALGIPLYLIPAFAEKSLALMYEAKGDARLSIAEGRYDKWISRAKGYEHLLRTGMGTAGQQRRKEPYGDQTSRGAAAPY